MTNLETVTIAKLPPIKVATAKANPELKHDKKQFRPSFNKLELLNLSAALSFAASASPSPEVISLARKISVYNMKANIGAVSAAYETSNKPSLADSIAELEAEAATMQAEITSTELNTSPALTKEEMWAKAYAQYKLDLAPLVNLSHDTLAMVCEHMYLNDLLSPEAETLAEAGEGAIEILTMHAATSSDT